MNYQLSELSVLQSSVYDTLSLKESFSSQKIRSAVKDTKKRLQKLPSLNRHHFSQSILDTTSISSFSTDSQYISNFDASRRRSHGAYQRLSGTMKIRSTIEDSMSQDESEKLRYFKEMLDGSTLNPAEGKSLIKTPRSLLSECERNDYILSGKMLEETLSEIRKEELSSNFQSSLFRESNPHSVKQWIAAHKSGKESFESTLLFSQVRLQELLLDEVQGGLPTKARAAATAELLWKVSLMIGGGQYARILHPLLSLMYGCVFENFPPPPSHPHIPHSHQLPSPPSTLQEFFAYKPYFEGWRQTLDRLSDLQEEMALLNQGVAMQQVVKKLQTIRAAFDSSSLVVRDLVFRVWKTHTKQSLASRKQARRKFIQKYFRKWLSYLLLESGRVRASHNLGIDYFFLQALVGKVHSSLAPSIDDPDQLGTSLGFPFKNQSKQEKQTQTPAEWTEGKVNKQRFLPSPSLEAYPSKFDTLLTPSDHPSSSYRSQDSFSSPDPSYPPTPSRSYSLQTGPLRRTPIKSNIAPISGAGLNPLSQKLSVEEGCTHIATIYEARYLGQNEQDWGLPLLQYSEKILEDRLGNQEEARAVVEGLKYLCQHAGEGEGLGWSSIRLFGDLCGLHKREPFDPDRCQFFFTLLHQLVPVPALLGTSLGWMPTEGLMSNIVQRTGQKVYKDLFAQKPHLTEFLHEQLQRLPRMSGPGLEQKISLEDSLACLMLLYREKESIMSKQIQKSKALLASLVMDGRKVHEPPKPIPKQTESKTTFADFLSERENSLTEEDEEDL